MAGGQCMRNYTLDIGMHLQPPTSHVHTHLLTHPLTSTSTYPPLPHTHTHTHAHTHTRTHTHIHTHTHTESIRLHVQHDGKDSLCGRSQGQLLASIEHAHTTDYSAHTHTHILFCSLDQCAGVFVVDSAGYCELGKV